MRVRLVWLGVVFCVLASARSPQRELLFDKLPLRFEANRGQAPDDVKFVARGQRYRLSLTANGSALFLGGVKLETKLAGADPHARLEGLDEAPGSTNYLVGSDPARWRTGIRTYGRVRYRNAYPGIDLVFYGSGGMLEYDFIVAPGADPSKIALDVQGALSMRVENGGDLALKTVAGEVRWRKPAIYQDLDGTRTQIEGRFVLRGRRVGFEVAAYDRSQTVVIDPVIAYGTYLGGKSNEGFRGIALDTAGNVYMAGYTISTNIPGTAGSLQPAYAGGTNDFETGDALIAKFNPQGAPVYITYLGGSADDFGVGIAADSAGNAYVTGITNSPNFSTTAGAYQRSKGGAMVTDGDAFVAKLNPSGTALIYSTLLGGSSIDRGVAIAIDSAGDAYIAGSTLSTNFPTSRGALQTAFKGTGGNPPLCSSCGPFLITGDAFVSKLDPAGATLLFSTMLGGSKDDAPLAIALDAQNNIYVAGSTLSSDFPVTPGSFQTTFHGIANDNIQPVLKLGDGFLSKISSDGAKLVYSTFLGGSRDDAILALAVDTTGAAYVTGATSSTDFPVKGAPQNGSSYHGPSTARNDLGFLFGDAFATKISPDGATLVYSTFLGGSADDAGWAIALDPTGAAYIGGLTVSKDFPLSADALQKTFGGGGDLLLCDAFLLKLDPTGASIPFSTLLGGDKDDVIGGIALDAAGNGYLAGNTLSDNFPVTPSAFQKIFGGQDDNYSGLNGDAFLLKISGLFTPAVTPAPAPTPAPTPTPAQPAAPAPTTVLNAASSQAGAIAPGEIIVVSGSGLGPATTVMQATDPATGLVTTSLAGTRVLFDGVPAPLVYASDKLTSTIVPYEIAGQTTTNMQVEYNGVQSAATTLNVAAAAPGLFSADFSGAGQGDIFNADSSPNSSSNPAASGTVITVLGTGEGQTDPPGVDGKIATDTLPTPLLGPPTVTIGGVQATVVFAGTAQGQPAGFLQIQAQIGDDTPSGDQPIVVTFGDFSSQPGITVAIQ